MKIKLYTVNIFLFAFWQSSISLYQKVKEANENNVNYKESLDFIVKSMWTGKSLLCMSQLCEASFIKTTHDFYIDVLLKKIGILENILSFYHFNSLWFLFMFSVVLICIYIYDLDFE